MFRAKAQRAQLVLRNWFAARKLRSLLLSCKNGGRHSFVCRIDENACHPHLNTVRHGIVLENDHHDIETVISY